MNEDLKRRAELESGVLRRMSHAPSAKLIDELIAECERLSAELPSALKEKLRSAEARIAELEQRDKRLMTRQGTFKGVGDPVLDACLGQPDLAFEAMRDSMPDGYWARYDLSAVRFGWHQRGLEQRAEQPKPEPVAWRVGACFFNFQDDAHDFGKNAMLGYRVEPLYTTPPAYATKPEPVATKLGSDPFDEREGPWWSLVDVEKLRALPVGTKLYTAPPAIPEGYALVPTDPTPEMVAAREVKP